MARIISTTETALQSSGTTYTVTLGEHIADDLLLICIDNDSASAAISTPTGWAAFGTAATSQNTRQAWFWKKATAPGTTNPQSTVANAVTIGTCLVIRFSSATPAHSWQRIDWGNSSSIKSAASNSVAASSAGGTTQITPPPNALLIYSWGIDGTSQSMRVSTNDFIPLSKVVASGVGHIIGYRQHGQSGNPPTATMYASVASEGGNGWVLAIEDDGTGELEKDGHTSDSIVQWYGNWGILHAAMSDEAVPLTWRALSGFSGSVGSIGAISCSSIAPAMDHTVIMTSQTFGTGSQLTSTESTAGSWVGGYHTITSTNMTDALFHLTYQMNNVVGTRHGSEGMIVAFSDGTNYAAYKLYPKDAMVANETKTLTLALGSAETYATSGSINWGAVTQIAYAFHRIGSPSTVATSFTVQNALLVTAATLKGGSATYPQSFAFLPSVYSGWGMYKQVDIQGSAQILGRSGIQVGNGDVITYFDSSASSTEYPVAYNSTTQVFWHLGTNDTAITVKAHADDTISLASSVIATTVGEELIISASGSTSADYSFNGTSIVGYKVTDNLGLSWSGTTFKGGDTVTIAGGGDLTNCTIANTTSANASLAVTADGSALDGCTINGTGAAYALELADGVTSINIIDCPITAGSTKKVHVLDANALHTVTITISGTTSLVAGDVTSAGAQVVIAAPELYQEVAITGLAATYRLQIFDIEYDLTVSGITVTPTAGATYTHNGITWTVRAASITAGAGTITVYGTGTPAASGTLTKTGGTGDASVAFSAYVVDGTELYIGVPGATSYTWTDSVAAAAPRVIRVRVMEDGPGTSDAIEMIDAIVGMCGITDGTESVGYLVAAVADDVYNDRGVDGSAITGITIDDTTLRLEIASGTITNYNGTDVLVVDGRDLYAYETYWLGTTDGMRDEARFIEAIDAVNFRCSNFKLKGTSGYPIMINNCFIVDAATGIFSSMVDYSGDPISNHPEHMKAIVVTTSDSVVTGTLSEFIAAVPTAADNATAVWSKTLPL